MDFVPVADLFRQLGDARRVEIFWLLCHEEHSVTHLAARLAMSSPAVSHHLRALKDAGLITGRREGKEVCYRAAETECARLLHRMIEQVMDVVCPREAAVPAVADRCAVPPENEREEVIRAVHDYLSAHLSERIPVEELCRRFAINPTALKEGFKKMYGKSLAAHIKEHRMERAAELLRRSEAPVADIAAAVGYDSQSKFTTAFKACYGMVPRDYRRTPRVLQGD